jgi:hypothetical protein
MNAYKLPSDDEVRARIAARKAREQAEAREREANGGKTLAELERERYAEQLRAFREYEREVEASNFANHMEALDRLMARFDKLSKTVKPEVVRELERVDELRRQAQRRADETFGL